METCLAVLAMLMGLPGILAAILALTFVFFAWPPRPARAEEKIPTPAPASGITTNAIKGLSRAEIRQKLQKLAETPPPKDLKHGAKCYDRACPDAPTRIYSGWEHGETSNIWSLNSKNGLYSRDFVTRGERFSRAHRRRTDFRVRHPFFKQIHEQEGCFLDDGQQTLVVFRIARGLCDPGFAEVNEAGFPVFIERQHGRLAGSEPDDGTTQERTQGCELGTERVQPGDFICEFVLDHSHLLDMLIGILVFG